MPTAGSLASVQAHTPVTNQPTTVVTTVGTTIVPAIGGPVIHTHPTPAGQSAALQMGDTTVSSGMILSPTLQPIPARLVRCICAGEFVEMRELLSDNITLIDQLEAVHGPLLTAATPGALRPRVREVPSLISWVFCFLAYTAVRTTDLTTRDMLAYCCLVVREGLRHGGQGWQDYDCGFRAIDPTLRWNSLLPDLQASTILGQCATGGTFCSLCRGVDHMAAQCALMYMQQLLTTPQAPAATPNIQAAPNTHGSANRRQPTLSRTRSARATSHICTSWNSGTRSFPGNCTYRHVCATCQLLHRAKDCPDTPNESPYKRASRPPSTTAASRR